MKTENLLTLTEISNLLTTHKSSLKNLSTKTGIAYGTLKNYLYGQSDIQNIPYRVYKTLSDYAKIESNPLRLETHAVLSPLAFYKLAQLVGRNISNRKQLAIDEYNNALICSQDETNDYYFFIDLAYQESYMNNVTHVYHESYLDQPMDQLKFIYDLSDDELNQIVTFTDKDIKLHSTNPVIVDKITTIHKPRSGNEDFVKLIWLSKNIHIFFTNSSTKGNRVTQNELEFINTLPYITEDQLKFLVDDAYFNQDFVDHLMVNQTLDETIPDKILVTIIRNTIERYRDNSLSNILACNIVHETIDIEKIDKLQNPKLLEKFLTTESKYKTEFINNTQLYNQTLDTILTIFANLTDIITTSKLT